MDFLQSNVSAGALATADANKIVGRSVIQRHLPSTSAPIAKLPSLEQLLMDDFHHVYEPSDDTFLLCDAIQQDHARILQSQPHLILEVGSGSGCVITFAAGLLQESGVQDLVSLATDINPRAAEATKRVASANNVAVEVVLGSFVTSFQSTRLERQVDVLLFNPPYVPTPSEEIRGTGIEVSWAGGKDGREVIDEYLPLIDKLLSPSGNSYMVLVEENFPQQIIDTLSEQYGLHSEIVLRRRAYNESLMILRTHR